MGELIEYTTTVWFWFILLAIQFALAFTYQAQLEKYKLAKPVFIIFVVEDWILNWLLTPFFLDLPKEGDELITGRMKRYKEKYRLPAWRKQKIQRFRYCFAVKLCNYLNKFDPGHC